MSSLGIRETQLATELPCLTAESLQRGELNIRALQQLHAERAVKSR